MPTPVRTLQAWSYLQSYYDGLYVGIDGLEGSGRSTVAASLQNKLQSAGYPAKIISPFPNTKTHKYISEIKHDRRLGIKSRHLLYASLFAIVTEHIILPHLAAGYIILSDRSWLSLYARAVAQGLDEQWVRTSLGFALMPDIIIEPQSDPITALRRKLIMSEALDPLESGSDNETLEGFIDFQSRMGQILHDIKPKTSWHVINIANPDALNHLVSTIIGQMEGRDVSS